MVIGLKLTPLPGERGSGLICLNGAAARCVSVGDKIIIMSYCQLEAQEAAAHKPNEFL